MLISENNVSNDICRSYRTYVQYVSLVFHSCLVDKQYNLLYLQPPAPPHTMTIILSQWPFSGNAKTGKSLAYNSPHTVYLNRIIVHKMILLDDDDNDDGMVEFRTTTDKKIHVK